MGLNTYPYSPFPASTEQLHKGDNEQIQAEIDQLKSDLTDLSEEVNGDATVYPYADVITIEDAVPANLADCKVKIEPVQSGTGTPSPENVRPISGHTEVDVQRDGVNIWDEQWENGTIDGATGNNLADNRYIRSKNYILIDENHQYMPVYSTIGTFIYMIYYDENKTHLGSSAQTNKTGTAFTPISGAKYMRFTILTGGQYNNYISINFPATYTSYVPYTGRKTYTIALGDTIYGGTVDFDSGVMKPMWASEVFDGTQTAQNVTRIDNVVRGQFVIQNSATYPQAISSYLEWVNDWGLDQPHFYIYDNKLNVFLPIPNDGTSTWDSYLASNPLQVCYPIATPTTIQLTPTQIQLLKGTNTITASTGQISVTVNGVSGSIGAVQEQVNTTDAALAELAEKLPTAPTTDGAYILTLTEESGTPAYSWESAE